MNVISTNLPEVVIIEPKVFGDDRGFFYESFNAKKFAELTGVDLPFVQDNHSMSAKNILRGLHYQIQQAQGKLVRVVSGEVFDVAVDLRKSSPRFGQWTGVTLSASNQRQLWIPLVALNGLLLKRQYCPLRIKSLNYWRMLRFLHEDFAHRYNGAAWPHVAATIKPAS